MNVEAIRAVAGEPAKVDRVAQLLKAVGNPVRLRLIAALCCDGEKSVSELVRSLDLAQAVVSQQLGILRLNGLVNVRSDGGFRRYSLAVTELSELLTCVSRCHLVTGLKEG
jgi:DNA-binding transcriptional ArsR family regulator